MQHFVKRLSKETAQALLARFVGSSAEVCAAVEAEVACHDVEPVDVSAVSRKASTIVTSLDGLPASQQFEPSCVVQGRLRELVDECKEKLSSTGAFVALVAIMDVVQSEEEGEVRKEVLSCGVFDGANAEELRSLAEDMPSEEKASISDVVDDFEGVVDALERSRRRTRENRDVDAKQLTGIGVLVPPGIHSG